MSNSLYALGGVVILESIASLDWFQAQSKWGMSDYFRKNRSHGWKRIPRHPDLFFGTNRANKLMDEAYAVVNEARPFSKEADAKYGQLCSDESLAGLPGNLAQLSPLAQDTANLMAKSAERYRAAADLHDKACGQGVHRTVADFWTLRSKAFHKLADAKDGLQQIALLLTDKGLENVDQFNAKAEPLVKSINRLSAECVELTSQAEKLQADNKEKFQ